MAGARTGVLLSNLGTPDSPSRRDVRRYLREFLSDPRVIDLPALPRWLLVNLAIAPFRPRTSAAAYQKIWGAEGSPLLAHGRALREAVARALGPDFVVALGMRYGRPPIREALSELAAAGVGRIVALPLYPQWAESSTGSTRACLEQAHRALPGAPPLQVLPAFFDAPGFIEAFAAVARPALSDARPDYVLFSYHGLPERQVKAADPTRGHCLASSSCCDAPPPAVLARCYRAQCLATTRALARALALVPGTFSTSFQSRLGRTPWIRPFTDHVLPELAASGVKRLAVLCPSFVADCLETLEEIGMRGSEQWHSLGGASLALVPSLNSHPKWIQTVAAMVRAA